MDQYIGKMLDNRYEILEVIGSGGMAVVYKALCHRLNRMVAIKVLRDNLAQDAEFRRRFHDESQAVAMLSHPNIVAVYDVSRATDLEYIVMELIDGITLKQYMQQKGGTLNWRETLHFITQIMKALSHAHSRGIIHRDIKPQNIMVLRDGSVKVADFGIARLASAAQNTLTQEALGSVHYISPEQARGSRIDARSDIYSAGVVLYEMLTGQLPFEGDTPVSVAIQHINSIPVPPRDLNQDIPEALEAITMKAMAPNVDNRYRSADDMLADLEAFRKNPSINFDYSPIEPLENDITNEPTQVISTGRHLHSGNTTARHRAVKPAANEEDAEIQHHNFSIPMAVIAIFVFVVGLGLFLWLAFFSNIFAAGDEHEVPQLTGKMLEDVMKDTTVTDVFTIDSKEVTSDQEKGIILSQDPEEGKTAKGDHPTITVEVSSGTEDELKMPDVTNKDYQEALTTLQNMGLQVATPTYENNDTVTRNHVIRFTPLEGTQVSSGDVVNLVISLGPPEKSVKVISFVGEDIQTVKSQLTLLSLNCGDVVPVDSDKAAGIVVFQSIQTDELVPEGTTINFQISKGPAESPSQSPDSTPSQSTDENVSPSSRRITIELPPGDSDSVQVRVEVGGNQQFDSLVPRNQSPISPMITGTGVQNVDVYFDDTYAYSTQVDFSSST
ncbi:MAG: Stk1 family PASTA domain-containing Ser/Thr kinase [Intestinimonas sp.]|jgi:serine/threonine-protein kinase|nr:Stk1 family PASTA domain-containing Ser/Thr kinase [Intestinimonas sp.]